MRDAADHCQEQLEQERRAREQAEQRLETKVGELYDTNRRLQALLEELEQRVEQRTLDLCTARDQALAAEQRAAAASAAKSSFLTNISHEIRTPMTAILGYAQLLLADGPRTPEQAAWCTDLLLHARYLTSLLDGVLDLSRIEAGQVELRLEPTPLDALLAEVEALHVPAAARKGLLLYREQRGEIPASLRTDRARVRQILVNLLDNAVRFTERGTITLRATGTLSHLCLEVEDTGPGIAPALQEHIWQPFEQGPVVPDPVRPGLGLGLNIARRLAVLLGGDLRMRSTPGQGSTFSVTLPLDVLPATLPAPSEEAGELPHLEGIHLLVVDDSNDNRRLMRLMLERAGAQVQVCRDGLEAVSLLQAAPGSAEVVLMDLQMPVLDGFAATRRLREAGFMAPIIAVTADATAETRARVAHSGFTDQLIKPLLAESFLRCIHSHLPAARRPQQPPPTRPRLQRQARIVLPEWLMVAFKQDLASRLAQLSTLKSTAEIRALAHKIAGSGGSYGYNELTVAARTLMVVCDRGGDVTGAIDTLMEESRAILEP